MHSIIYINGAELLILDKRFCSLIQIYRQRASLLQHQKIRSFLYKNRCMLWAPELLESWKLTHLYFVESFSGCAKRKHSAHHSVEICALRWSGRSSFCIAKNYRVSWRCRRLCKTAATNHPYYNYTAPAMQNALESSVSSLPYFISIWSSIILSSL